MDQFGQLFATINAGVNLVDEGQTVTFIRYVRQVLPIDGFVFWSPSQVFDKEGALHFAQSLIQNDEETFAQGMVSFTAQEAVQEFEEAPTNVIFVATLPGGSRYAFSSQEGFLNAAKQYHYFGRTIPPAALSQLLDKPGQIDLSRVIVSNSLPFWLGLNNYSTPYGDGYTNSIPVYPSKLVSPNLAAPYVAVKIVKTDSDQMSPYLDPNRSSFQNATDVVRLVMYGLQNNESIDFSNCVRQYLNLTRGIGARSSFWVVDEQREVTELETIAMKKTMEVTVNYNQIRIDAISRRLIRQASMNFIIGTLGQPGIALGTQGGSPFATQSGQQIEAQ